MATLLIQPRIQFFDNNGNPLAAGKVYTYAAGTTTPKDTWEDQGKVATNTNPIILDDGGRADIWLDGAYKIDVRDSNDVSVDGYPVDDVIGYDARDWTGLTATIADLNATHSQAVIINDDYTITLADRGKIFLCDCQSKSFTVDLPANSATSDTFQVVLKKIDDTNNTVTIDPAGSETIDDKSTFILYDYFDFVKLQSDCSNWNIIAAEIRGTIRTITSDTNIDLTYESQTILIDASSNDVTANLDAAATLGSGYTITFKRVDSTDNLVRIDPNGSETIDGITTFDINEQYESVTIKCDGSNWYVIELSSAPTFALPKDYISSIIINRDAGDTDHDINISAGEARDAEDSINMELSSSLIKKIDAAWEIGTNQGGFPRTLSLTGNTWYFVHLIAKPDGTTDAGFDTSKTASNLLADSQVVAGGYTKYRRIGSIKTDASQNIIDFHINAYGMTRQYKWIEPPLDYNSVISGVVPASVVTVTLASIPLDIEVNVKIWGSLEDLSLLAEVTALYFSYQMDNAYIISQTFARNLVILNIAQFVDTLIQSNDLQQIKFYHSAIGATESFRARAYTVGWVEDLTKE